MCKVRKEEKLASKVALELSHTKHLHRQILTYKQLEAQKLYLSGFSREIEPIGHI